MKRTLHDGSRTIESANPKNRVERDRMERRSLSLSGDKKIARHTISEPEGSRDYTMEELMRIHPLVEKKMSHIRKKRYLKAETNNFPQIQEVE